MTLTFLQSFARFFQILYVYCQNSSDQAHTKKLKVILHTEQGIIETGQHSRQMFTGMSKVKQIFYITSSVNRRAITTLHVTIVQAQDNR